MTHIDVLTTRYPLPSGFTIVETVDQSVTADRAEIRVAGIVAQKSMSEAEPLPPAMGSAALLDPPSLSTSVTNHERPRNSSVAIQVVERAYFELQERCAMLSAMYGDQPLPLRNAQGEQLGELTAALAFPSSDDPAWQYARSNGVALGPDWKAACDAARWELVERDAVLRAWYGQSVPEQVKLSAVDPALFPSYQLEAYDFPAMRGVTVGVFAFPRTSQHLLAFGFAADESREAAAHRAARECVQRMAFLWDEESPQEPLAFSPSSAYHQDYYLVRDRVVAIRAWLAGEHASEPCVLSPRSVDESWRYVDLTLSSGSEPLRIAKALPAGELSLVFGRHHPEVLGPIPERMRVHPIP